MTLFVMINMMAAALVQPAVASGSGAEIRDGAIIMHFLRSVSFRLYVLCIIMGKDTYRMVTSALPALLAFWMQAIWRLSGYLNAKITFLDEPFIPLWFYPQFFQPAFLQIHAGSSAATPLRRSQKTSEETTPQAPALLHPLATFASTQHRRERYGDNARELAPDIPAFRPPRIARPFQIIFDP
jgi:hypothetical protein